MSRIVAARVELVGQVVRAVAAVERVVHLAVLHAALVEQREAQVALTLAETKRVNFKHLATKVSSRATMTTLRPKAI